jgi:hypothetical protein
MQGHDWKLIRDVTTSTQACSDAVLREGRHDDDGDKYDNDCLSLLQGQHSAKHSTAVEDLSALPSCSPQCDRHHSEQILIKPSSQSYKGKQ